MFIKVTINYRLNALGWISLGREGVDGNQGLYDMVAGLKWVQNNIGNFGGDPDQVTIFGESAGSWACSYLLVSPLAKVELLHLLASYIIIYSVIGIVQEGNYGKWGLDTSILEIAFQE